MASRRTRRGRLSSIERLPPEAEPIVAWAIGELQARRHRQVDILDRFNLDLRKLAAKLGRKIEPISLSAFNRYAIRLAAIARRLEETREITATIGSGLQPGEAYDLTQLVAAMIKGLVFELLEDTARPQEARSAARRDRE